MGRLWQYDYRPTHCCSKREINYNFPWGEKSTPPRQQRLPPKIFSKTTSFPCSEMPSAARAGVPCYVGDACDVCDGEFSLHHRSLLGYSLPLKQTANRPV